jgi:hypothetical protein
MPRSDKQMVRVAQVVGASSNLRDLLRRAERDEPGRLERERAEWSELWACLDGLVALIDW